MEEDALRLIDELVPPSDTRSTSRSPATPVDERDWSGLLARVVNGYDNDEIGYHSLGRNQLPQRWHPRYPDDADGDPEVDMDTVPQFPPIMIPPAHPRSTSLRITTNAHPNPTRAAPNPAS
ncbi:hypothetical protein BGW80DRAFT_1462956 [Lactifluus volemus]|nr:hypothetical protein BGW80DRAFT_1462956 [Lactifluus volemus]